MWFPISSSHSIPPPWKKNRNRKTSHILQWKRKSASLAPFTWQTLGEGRAGRQFTKISSSLLALGLTGSLKDFSRDIILVFSNKIFRENWGWIIWQRTRGMFMRKDDLGQAANTEKKMLWFLAHFNDLYRQWSRQNMRHRGRSRYVRYSHCDLVAFFPTTEVMWIWTRFQSNVANSEMTAAFGMLVSPKFPGLLSPKFPDCTVQNLSTPHSSPRKGLTLW